MSQNPITPAGQGATPVAPVHPFRNRVLTPGINRQHLWLLEDHEATTRELHRVQVETSPGDPRREEAERKQKAAADRVLMFESDCAAELTTMLRFVIKLGRDGILCDLLKQLPIFDELQAENKRLRRHLGETRKALANEIAKRGEGVFA